MREFDVNGNIKSNELAGPPSGPAGGDLAGTFPNPTVVATGLAVKVAFTAADGFVKRNSADSAWEVINGGAVTGSRVANPALASLLTELALVKLITDSTSA